MGIFYVYEHWRPDKTVCFWVGKGKGRRAYNFERNSHYNRIVAKLARLGMCVEVRLISNGLSEKKAHIIECKRIKFWRSRHNELANKTDGGEGVSGLKMPLHVVEMLRLLHIGKKASEETKKKMSKSSKGKKKTTAHRKNISLGRIGIKQPSPSAETRAKISAANLGKKMSKSARAKIRKAHLGKKVSKPVRKRIGRTVKALWTNPVYRAQLLAAHAKRSPISKSTHRKMRVAQRARRMNYKVSDKTRAKVSASIKEWHRQAGHTVS